MSVIKSKTQEPTDGTAFRIIQGKPPQEFEYATEVNEALWVFTERSMPSSMVRSYCGRFGMVAQCIADGPTPPADATLLPLKAFNQAPPPEKAKKTAPKIDSSNLLDIDAFLSHRIPIETISDLETDYTDVMRLQKSIPIKDGDTSKAERRSDFVRTFGGDTAILSGKAGLASWKTKDQELRRGSERWTDEKKFNIGTWTGGKTGNGLFVVDLDSAESRDLAASYLPRTRRVTRDPYKDASHWHYRISDAADKTQDHTEFQNATQIECLYGSHLVVLPPSVGFVKGTKAMYSRYRFVDDAGIQEIELEELLPHVRRLAAATTAAKMVTSNRDDFLCSAIGALLRAGMEPRDVESFMQPVADWLDANAANSSRNYASTVPDKVQRFASSLKSADGSEGVRGFESLQDWLKDNTAAFVAWAQGKTGAKRNKGGRRAAHPELPEHLEAAQSFVDSWESAQDYAYADDELYYFSGRLWRLDENGKRLRAEVERFLQWLKQQHVNEETGEAPRLFLGRDWINATYALVRQFIERKPNLKPPRLLCAGGWAYEDGDFRELTRDDGVRECDTLAPYLTEKPVLGATPEILQGVPEPVLRLWQKVIGGTIAHRDRSEEREVYRVQGTPGAVTALLCGIRGYDSVVPMKPSPFFPMEGNQKSGGHEDEIASLPGHAAVLVRSSHGMGPKLATSTIVESFAHTGQFRCRAVGKKTGWAQCTFDFFEDAGEKFDPRIMEKGLVNTVYLSTQGFPEGLLPRDLETPEAVGWAMAGAIAWDQGKRGLSDAERALTTPEGFGVLWLLSEGRLNAGDAVQGVLEMFGGKPPKSRDMAGAVKQALEALEKYE